MNVKINIQNTEPKVNIIKDQEAEEQFILDIATKVVNDLAENPEMEEKVRLIGKEKLLEIALQSLRESIKQSEEKQIAEAQEMSKEITAAILSGIVNAALEFTNKA